RNLPRTQWRRRNCEWRSEVRENGAGRLVAAVVFWMKKGREKEGCRNGEGEGTTRFIITDGLAV
ncbi:hypothetical protein PIB30_108042, partial [Stylosanthes scabra]|nr:hypothetical protein [Stylosanthes scabra]